MKPNCLSCALKPLALAAALSFLLFATPNAKAQTTASVSVNTTAALGKIPPDDFGLNAAIWDGNMFDSTVPSLLKAINTRILRYPGGSASDGYYWEQHVTSTTTGTADFNLR